MELRVGGLQGHFLTVADNLLAPEVPWPIRAQEARRSVTSLDSGHSLAPKFSWPIRALKSPEFNMDIMLPSDSLCDHDWSGWNDSMSSAGTAD
jgi:hypothetical protein